MSAFVSPAGNFRPWLLGAALLFGLSAHAQDNLHFHGALVAKPCVVAPESERAEVNLGTIQRVELTTGDMRTRGTDFALRLEQCDTRLATINFTETAGGGHDGCLYVDADSTNGTYICIETVDGKQIPVGEPSQAQGIVDGDNQLRFRAYVRKQPDFWEDPIPGAFTATANFRISYD